jgi:ribosomal protein S12 methylthiotransferase accessory factor
MAHLLAIASERDRNTILLDLTHDFEIPVVAAVNWHGDSFTRPRIGVGIAFDQKDAAYKALSELVSQLVTLPIDPLETAAAAKRPPPDHIIGDRRAGRPSWSTSLAAKSDVEQLTCLLCKLRDRGLRCLVVDQSITGKKAFVVRIIVPGLRSLAARFGPGRLFNIPSETFKVVAKSEAQMAETASISKTFMSDTAFV